MGYDSLRILSLGPFVVNFDDVGLTDWDTAPGAKLVDLPDGTVVLAAYAIPTGGVSWSVSLFEIWVSDDAGTSYEMCVGYKTDGSMRDASDPVLSEISFPEPTLTVFNTNVGGTVTQNDYTPGGTYLAMLSKQRNIVVANHGAALRAYAVPLDPPLSSGQMTVYAIIVTPG